MGSTCILTVTSIRLKVFSDVLLVADYDFSRSVTGILNRLKWCSLDVRRQVVMFHKILQGSVTLNLPHEISLLHTTRGHDRHYQIPFSRIDTHKLVSFQLNAQPSTALLNKSITSLHQHIIYFI